MINVFQPKLGKEELAAIKKVFASNWVGKGKVTAKFESQFAQHLGVKKNLVHSTTCCTEGLFQSMNLVDVGMGDEVIMPSLSFVGAANAVIDAKAKAVFCDVDPRTLNPTAEMIESKLSQRTRAVVVLHYGGYPCEMDEIIDLCKKSNIYLIEDCACAVASSYKKKMCGTLGDIGIWSFDSMKVLVTCDGAMVYCKNEVWADKFAELVSFGMSSQSGVSKANAVDQRWWEFEVNRPGRRAIMNDVTAAIGVEQMKKLHDVIEWRNMIHNSYNVELADIDGLLLPPPLPDYSTSTYYFYWIQHPKRDELARFLKEKDVYTTFRYYPLHRVEFYGVQDELPGADQAADTTLCLPIHQSLKLDEVEYICDAIKEFCSE